MQYGQQTGVYPGHGAHGVPYPGPPTFPRQGPAMPAGAGQQGTAAPSWQYAQAPGLQQLQQAHQYGPITGMQQQKAQGNLQQHAPPVAQQQPMVQPVSFGQQAGSMPCAGLVLSAELLDSLKSLAPALQQLKQPDT